MPKFRFSTVDRCSGFTRKQKQEITHFAFDTQEVVAWTTHSLGDDTNNLELWLKGVVEPLSINEEVVGAVHFRAILELLASEFPEIDSLNLTIA